MVLLELKIFLLHFLPEPNHIRKCILGLWLCLIGLNFNAQEIGGNEPEASGTCGIRFEELADAILRLEKLDETDMLPKHKLLLLDALPPTQMQSPLLCAYTLTSDSLVSQGLNESQEFRTVERFTPLGEATQQWSLLRINGQSPTNQDLDLYEMDQNARIREVRTAPWRLERALPLHVLKVVTAPEVQQKVVYTGHFNFSPQQDLDIGEFEVTLVVDEVNRRLERYSIALQTPIQPNLLSSLSQYELTQDWVFNKAVNRIVRSRTYYRIAGGMGDERFWSQATSTTSEFYCPTETLEAEFNAEDPCTSEIVLEPIEEELSTPSDEVLDRPRELD